MATMTERMHDKEMRPDLRYYRAQQLTSAIMTELENLIEYDEKRIIYEHLMSLFHDNGWAIETDKDRKDRGLEPRDNFGWTPSERVAEKHRRNEAMLAMANIMVKPPLNSND